MAEIIQYLGFDINGGEVERLLGDKFETHIPSANEVKYRIDGREVTVHVGDWVHAEGWLVPAFTRTAMEHAAKRLSEMRAQLEALADELGADQPHYSDLGIAAERVREVARG